MTDNYEERKSRWGFVLTIHTAAGECTALCPVAIIPPIEYISFGRIYDKVDVHLAVCSTGGAKSALYSLEHI